MPKKTIQHRQPIGKISCAWVCYQHGSNRPDAYLTLKEVDMVPTWLQHGLNLGLAPTWQQHPPSHVGWWPDVRCKPLRKLWWAGGIGIFQQVVDHLTKWSYDHSCHWTGLREIYPKTLPFYCMKHGFRLSKVFPRNHIQWLFVWDKNPPACRRVLWILLVRSCSVRFVSLSRLSPWRRSLPPPPASPPAVPSSSFLT